MAESLSAWSYPVRLVEVPPAGMTVELKADETARAAIARGLDLLDLLELTAKLSLKPWMDGVEIEGGWRARFGQACGITLERLDQALSGQFVVRMVPEGSDHAPSPESLTDLDPEADDPPDVGDVADLAAYVVEYFALEIDPFPRKEGAEFEPPPPDPEASPFAVLRRLRKDDPA